MMRLFTYFVFIGLLFGCSDQDSEPIVHDIDYALTWNTDQVDFDSSGFSLTSNLGVTVVIRTAYLVLYSTQLVACENGSSSVIGKLYDWFMPSIAHAGHGGENRDPSAMVIPTVENLVLAERIELGSQKVADRVYCQIHYLVGRAEDNAQFLPEDRDLIGTSLYLEGSWSHEGDEASTEFIIDTSTAYGALSSLYPSGGYGDDSKAYELDTNASGASVVIERSLSGMFDDVDWREMNATAVERKVLSNIIEQVSITVTPTGSR
jgi:hypothetical protein